MEASGFDDSGEDTDSDSLESLKKKLLDLEEKMERISLQTGEGYHALRNQRRLKTYLEHLVDALEDHMDGSLPDPPRLEDMDE